MFQDLLHFQTLACTDAVAYSGSPDYSKIDGNGNVFCAYSKSTVTGKDRSAKDGEWPDYAATSTVTVRTHEKVKCKPVVSSIFVQ